MANAMSTEMPDDHPCGDKKSEISIRKKKSSGRTKAGLQGGETGSRQTHSIQQSVRAAKNIFVAYVEHEHFTEAQDFLCELEQETLTLLKKTYPVFVRALVKLYIHKKEFARVYKMAEEGFGSLTEDEKLKIWDETHYTEKEQILGKPLTPLLKFRVRQRNPPPEGVCAAGSRPSNALPAEAKEKMREWLNAHLEHPYPDMEERTNMAKATGLKENQVRTWFANARRRLRAKQKEEAIMAEQKRAQKRVLESTTNTGTHQSLSHSIEAILESHPSYQHPLCTQSPLTTPQLTPPLKCLPPLPPPLKGHAPSTQVSGQLSKEGLQQQQQEFYISQMAAQMGEVQRERAATLGSPPMGRPGSSSLLSPTLAYPGVGRLASAPVGGGAVSLMKNTTSSLSGYANVPQLAGIPQWQALPPHLYQGLGQLRMPHQEAAPQRTAPFSQPDPMQPPSKMFCPCLNQQQKAACASHSGLPPFCSLTSHHHGNKVPQSPVSPQCTFSTFRFPQPDHVTTPTTLTFGSQPFDGHQHPSMHHHNLEMYANDHSYYRFLASPDMQMRFPAGPVTSTPKPSREESSDSLLFQGHLSDLAGFNSPTSFTDSGMLSPTMVTAPHFSPPAQPYMQMPTGALYNAGKTGVTLPTQHSLATCRQPVIQVPSQQYLVPSSASLATVGSQVLATHTMQREPTGAVQGVGPPPSCLVSSMAALRHMTQAPGGAGKVTILGTREVGESPEPGRGSPGTRVSPSTEHSRQAAADGCLERHINKGHTPVLQEAELRPRSPLVIVGVEDVERPNTPELPAPLVKTEPYPKVHVPPAVPAKMAGQKSAPAVEKSVLAKLAEMVQQRQQEYDTMMAQRRHDNPQQKQENDTSVAQRQCDNLQPKQEYDTMVAQRRQDSAHQKQQECNTMMTQRQQDNGQQEQQEYDTMVTQRRQDNAQEKQQECNTMMAQSQPYSAQQEQQEYDSMVAQRRQDNAQEKQQECSTMLAQSQPYSAQQEQQKYDNMVAQRRQDNAQEKQQECNTMMAQRQPYSAQQDQQEYDIIMAKKQQDDSQQKRNMVEQKGYEMLIQEVDCAPLTSQEDLISPRLYVPYQSSAGVLIEGGRASGASDTRPEQSESSASSSRTDTDSDLPTQTADEGNASEVICALKNTGSDKSAAHSRGCSSVVLSPDGSSSHSESSSKTESATSTGSGEMPDSDSNSEESPLMLRSYRKAKQKLNFSSPLRLSRPSPGHCTRHAGSLPRGAEELCDDLVMIPPSAAREEAQEEANQVPAVVEPRQQQQLEYVPGTLVDDKREALAMEVKATEPLTQGMGTRQTAGDVVTTHNSSGIQVGTPPSDVTEECDVACVGDTKADPENANSGYSCFKLSSLPNQQPVEEDQSPWKPARLDVNGNEILPAPSANQEENKEPDGDRRESAGAEPEDHTHEHQECARALLDLHMCDKQEDPEP